MGAHAGPDINENGLVLALDAGSPKNYLTAVEVLVVAGGGGGGMDMGGGGGGGGVIYNSNVTVTPDSPVTVTVGAGGYGAPAGGGGYRTDGAGPQPNSHQFTIPATNGGNSVFGALTAIGGGAGGSSYRAYTPGIAGANGGSGGGSSGYNDNAGTFYGGTGTSGQGFAGGNSTQAYRSGGGGGAGGPGVSSPNQPDGGPGVIYPTMSPYYFGGGGGGASYSLSTGGNGGIGGGGGGALGTTVGGAGLNNGSPGGGGGPNQWAQRPGGNAGANTGGGGGGGSHYNSNNKGGEGGSGIVIVRYPGPQKAIGGTVTSVDGHTIHTFTTVGSTTFTPLSATNNSSILGLADFSGNNIFATSVNGVVYSSANGGSLSFDGSNDYITTGFTRGTLGNYLSISVWYKYLGTSGRTYSAIIGGKESGAGTEFFIGKNTGNTNIGIQDGNYNGSFVTGSNAFDGNWHQLVYTYDNGTGKIYLDSVLKNTGSFTKCNDAEEIVIGGEIEGSGYHFEGYISSVSFHSRVLTAEEIKQNYNSLKRRFILDGSTSDRAAPSASHLVSLGITTNGSYWLKPSGYSGEPEIVYIDFDGSESGITDAGPWVRVRYAQDYYSRAAAWSGQTGLTDPASENTTAFSGVFDYEQSYSWIDSLLDNSTEVRQTFESWGYGSVGWTYLGNSAYNEARGFDNRNYTRWGGNGGTHVGASGVGRVPGMSHSVTSINGPFDNPTANGTDPTDLNDAVWRVGVFYFRYTGDPATRKPLPIRGMYNADVDGATEQRYFPFRTGEASPGVNSDIWIKN